jgi:CPA2 family monovalent cation:H+ antiporter-2
MIWAPTVAIALVAALLFGLVARRIGLSPIVGYLLAGVAVGPHTPGFVGDASLAGQIADVGVILLMFGVGLGFSLRDLVAVRRVAVPGALAASTVTIACATLVGRAMGIDAGAALVFGMCFASASTVVIVRGMIELDLLTSAAGRIAVGWSVVEDLIVIVVLVLLPALAAGGAGESAGALLRAIALSLGKVALLALVVFAVGPLLVPRLLDLVARARSRELFTLAVLAIALGIAFLAAELFEVSIALGAFLGGMVVGRSDLSHQAAADALPLRDAFAVLFFVAVGMLFDPIFVVDHPALVLAALGVVLVVKPLVAVAVMLFKGHPLRTALTVGAGLAQVSEFSFVLVGMAVKLGTLPQEASDLVVSTVLLSIALSPVLFRATGPLERWLSRRRAVARFVVRRAGRLGKLPSGESEALRGHAVLLGHGRVGAVLAGFLRQRGVPFVVVDQDRLVVDQLRKSGTMALYGDAGSPVLLGRARVADARVLLVTTPDPVTARLAVEHAHEVNASIDVVARVHQAAVEDSLKGFPRTQGVHGELELAYAMARLMLQRFGVSAIEAEATVIDSRRVHAGAAETRTRIVEIRVPASSPVIGRTIATLGLPRGALVITIARGREFVLPSGQTEVLADDALLVLADREIALAIEKLVAGRAEVAAEGGAEP